MRLPIDEQLFEKLKRFPNEDKKKYLRRVFVFIAEHPIMIDWHVVTRILNNQLNRNSRTDVYTRQYDRWLQGRSTIEPPDIIQVRSKEDEYTQCNLFETSVNYLNEESSNSNAMVKLIEKNQKLLDEIRFATHEFQKERIKLQDERTHARADARVTARNEVFLEAVKYYADKLSSVRPLPKTLYPLSVGAKERIGILCLSDWHFGMQVNLSYNYYDVQTCIDRLIKLKQEVISKGKELQFSKLIIVNLSDLISGRIKKQHQIQNQYNVAEQINGVIDMLTCLITDLSEYFEIDYYDCLDNHSRIEPNKKDSIDSESYCLIISGALERYFKNHPRVNILYNKDDDIINFNVFDYEVAAVHGHDDKTKDTINNLTGMAKKPLDMVMTAHLHHFLADEKQECVQLGNGSLIGADDYSHKLRVRSKPSQNLVIACKDNLTEFICKINV